MAAGLPGRADADGGRLRGAHGAGASARRGGIDSAYALELRDRQGRPGGQLLRSRYGPCGLMRHVARMCRSRLSEFNGARSERCEERRLRRIILDSPNVRVACCVKKTEVQYPLAFSRRSREHCSRPGLAWLRRLLPEPRPAWAVPPRRDRSLRLESDAIRVSRSSVDGKGQGAGESSAKGMEEMSRRYLVESQHPFCRFRHGVIERYNKKFRRGGWPTHIHRCS